MSNVKFLNQEGRNKLAKEKIKIVQQPETETYVGSFITKPTKNPDLGINKEQLEILNRINNLEKKINSLEEMLVFLSAPSSDLKVKKNVTKK
jgi:hypothetical protein